MVSLKMIDQPLRKSLIDWYDKEKRDLPWRRINDPWLILLSEVYYEILPKSENLLPLHNAYRNLNAFLKTIYIFFQNDMISKLLYLP